MSFTMKQLRYFLAVAEAGQVSAAANNVNVSQSAMTLAIQDLEAGLGVQLFDRKSTGLELTREGTTFLTHAAAIQEQVARATQSVHRLDDPLTGTLRVGVTETLASYFLFPKLARFRREHPDLIVELREATRAELEAMLLAGTIDVALLLTSNIEEKRKLTFRTFHRSRRRLWTAAGHPIIERPSVSLADLSIYPFVLLKSDEAERQARSFWSTSRIEPQVIFETASIEAVRTMVAHGLAITVLSDVVFRSWTIDGLRVLKRNLNDDLPTMDVGMAWRKSRSPTPIMNAFIEEFEPVN